MKPIIIFLSLLLSTVCSAQEATYYIGPFDKPAFPLCRSGDSGKFSSVPGYCVEIEVDVPFRIETLVVAKFGHIYKDYKQPIAVSHHVRLIDLETGHEMWVPGSKEGANIRSRKIHYAVIPGLGFTREEIPPGQYLLQLYASAGSSKLKWSTVCAELIVKHTVMRVRVY